MNKLLVLSAALFLLGTAVMVSCKAEKDTSPTDQCAALYSIARNNTDSLIVDTYRPLEMHYEPSCSQLRLQETK